MAEASSGLTDRASPNILITGTPGTGKSTMAEALAAATGLRAINVGDLVKEKQLHSGWDEKYESHVLDEDRVCDELEEILEPGGSIVDYHGCDFFPERWFDLVIVLRTDNSVLYSRLEARSYSQHKLTENVEAEIMQVILDEARESYAEEVVVELPSNTVDDIDSNVQRTVAWLQAWKAKRS